MRAYDLGSVPYLDAWRLQEALATRLRLGGDECLLLLEHPHVFTIGRRGTADHLLAPVEELRALGASAYRVDRGGDITYHGPGQLVAYPIVDLDARRADLVAYVRGLESAFIATAAAFGIAAQRVEGRTGVWITPQGQPPAKLAAIGVRVSRGVTTHGVALNVATDLSWFARMLPCGFSHAVASFASLGVSVSVNEVKPVLISALAEALGATIEADPAQPVPPRDEEIPPDAPVRSAVDLLRELLPA
jgi:lipoyl(octanoyl) transferase